MYPDLVTVARGLATAAHANIFNEVANEPYILHPGRVSGYAAPAIRILGLEDKVNSQEAQAVGWVHDTVEDTWVTEKILHDTFFAESPDVVNSTLDLTRPPGGGGDLYYREIRHNPLSLVGKFADMMDNADPVRIARVKSRSKREHFETKYDHAADVMGVREELEAWKTERRAMVRRVSTPKSTPPLGW